MARTRLQRVPSVPAEQPALIAIESLSVEAAIRRAGYRCIVGLDEVGRGCWAGPVYAAAVVLPDRCYEDRRVLAGVTDSKLLSPSRRETLATAIEQCAIAVAIGWAEAPVVDRLNILGATRLAMRAALECVAGPQWIDHQSWGAQRAAGKATPADYLVTDAVPMPEVAVAQQAVIQGDRRCLAVAAASIVAKVARDGEMRRRATRYPAFGFADNKGYGTREHLRALLVHGVTPLHRRTFAPVKYLLGMRDHVGGTLPPPRDAR